MITPEERAFIHEHAYVPEHLPHYVTAISGTEPFLVCDFVVHLAGARLIFIGYPLIGGFKKTKMLEALNEARARFDPAIVSILAPALPTALQASEPLPEDKYYRLELIPLRVPKKVRNMLTRARREVRVSIGEFSREHQRLIHDFMKSHSLDGAMQRIFQRVHEYAKYNDALVFDARTPRGELVAFNIADFGAREYAFYVFNFRSQKHHIPGVCDLLLAYVIADARTKGKHYINLGLGIDPGIAFFKKKWGATPFLKHVSCALATGSKTSWSDIVDHFSKM